MLCNGKKLRLRETEGYPEDVPMLAEILPKAAIPSFMEVLKGKTDRRYTKSIQSCDATIPVGSSKILVRRLLRRCSGKSAEKTEGALPYQFLEKSRQSAGNGEFPINPFADSGPAIPPG